MKKTIYILIAVVLLFSCKSGDTPNEDISQNTEVLINDLLPQAVIVYSEVNFKTHAFPEWVSGVDSILMCELNENLINSDLELYSSNIYYDPETKIVMTDDDIRVNMDADGLINALYFIEKWSFNEASYSFGKEVVSWSPVHEFYKKTDGKIDSTKKAKKLLYDLRTLPGTNEKKIAENITYEVDFSGDHKTNEYLNIEKFTHLIIDPVLSGNKKALEFFDRIEMTNLEIKQIFGWSVDSVEVENIDTGKFSWDITENKGDLSTVEAFIFVEDWYMDLENFSIRKEVKSIAPVMFITKVDMSGEAFETKKIAFIVDL